MDKITISIRVGESTFSFDTEPNGSEISSAMDSIRSILTKYGKKLGAFGSTEMRIPRSKSLGRSTESKGKAETSLILQKLQQAFIPEGYFKEPRNTHDVRSALESRFHIKFLSRKVSQALGNLHRRGILSRVGSKGDFRYITLP